MGPYKGHADFSAAFLLDILLINLSSFLALFTRMELDLTALLESGFLDSIYRYALMDTVCTILIFWFFRLYNSLWAYAGTNELTRIAAASIVAAAVKYVGMHLLALPTPKKLPCAELYVSHGLCGLQPLGLPLFPGHPAPQPEERSSKAHHADRRW